MAETTTRTLSTPYVSDKSALTAFRRRRAINWLTLGLTYSAMYTGRYNLSLANPILSKTYGWDKAQIGSIISPALFAYGVFAMVNGPIADKIGGRKAMLIGCTGTITFNFLFGLGAYLGLLGTGTYLLGYFSTVWMLNSYFQSFSAISLIKVNAAWFQPQERGVFSAIFGSMIQLGRTLIFLIGPIVVLYLPWQWLFFVPSIIISAMALMTYLFVQNSPENCGLTHSEHINSALDAAAGNEPTNLKYIVKKIFTSPVMLCIAVAEFCTGFVRQGFEQWFPRYMVEVHQLSLESSAFQKSAILVVLAGIVGAFIAGILSDWVFKGRRTPVACLGYFVQVLSLFVIWQSPSLGWVSVAFVMNSCALTVVHSMLSGTASMDFGGKKAAATAAGFFDGMQYIGGSFVGYGMGWLLDRFGWYSWGPSMIGFSLVGMILMIFLWNARAD